MAEEKKKYVTTYKPSLLSSLPRQKSRETLGITDEALPFRGIDTWNAWEFSWLNQKGKPEVAVLTFEVPAKSPHLIESKSLKLYLGSYSGTKFGYRAEVISTLESDLTLAAQAPVNVMLYTAEQIQGRGIGMINGTSLDSQDIDISDYYWDPEHLVTEGSTIVRENLFTHMFSSLCPLTGQPDHATVQIQYSGPTISHAGLLRYLVSYRNHEEFAEQVTERIFVDIMNRCSPDRLTVQTHFTRRGGVDINSVRSHEDVSPTELRLWRQ